MTDFTYVLFVLAAAVFGGFLGMAAYMLRVSWAAEPGDFQPIGTWEVADDLELGLDYAVGRYELNDKPYLERRGPGRLIAFMCAGASIPLLAGLLYWSQRDSIVGATCGSLLRIGLHPPFCG